ncbi:MAG: YveK family protein [Anaerolineae bacterium]
MKIQEYVRILRHRGWIILLAVVVTAASAFVFSKLQTPVYRSSIEVSIQLARPDFGLAQSAKLLLNNFSATMWSEQYAQEVIDRLALYYTAKDLKSNVTFAVDDARMVIKIDVDDYDGEQANRIANTWAQLFWEWRDAQNKLQNKEDRVFAEAIDPASYRQLRPKTTVNVAAGGIFGLVIGVVIVFVLEWLEAGIVRLPQELERETGVTVIGVIPPAQ